MNFESLVPKNARLRGHISQKSNLRYVKKVVKHFDERQREDFRNSCLGFGIQEYALVTGLRCGLLPDDNVMERVLDKRRLKDKYFKHVDKISYALLEQTFLRLSMPLADRYNLDLALIIKGVFNAPDNNVGIDMETLSIVNDLDLFFSYPWGRISYGRLIRGFRGRWAMKFLDATKRRRRRLVTWSTTFPLPCRYRHLRRYPKLVIGSIGVLVNISHDFSAGHQQSSRSSLHVYATLCPNEVECGQPHNATLVSFDDRPVPALDDLARDSVAPQFHAERLGTPEEGTSEDETFNEAHEGSGTSGEEEQSEADDSGEAEGEDSKDHDSGDSDGDRARRNGQIGTFSTPYVHRATSPMPALSTSYARSTAMARSSLTTDDVHGTLLDQRILIEMRLRTVKLEIIQHVSDKFKKLKDFISTVVLASDSTTTACAADVDPDPRQSDYEGFADYAGHHPSREDPNKEMEIERQEGDDIAHIQPCPDDHPVPVSTNTEEVRRGHPPSPGNRNEERDMLPIGTEHLQDTADIELCPDNDPKPVPTETNEVQGIPSFIEN
ncbi:Hypothetical predicted protein [Olea europaea subsp. europaea]|uniref:DUF1985 domain-containing protein n=1 Tax=Olea europaea subsp. europaea TaxID=158383 RepID=A0A8S0QVZ8_OLEEU|nr:Hypothetical predicted protein [Olea europaea subsp. europaea]